MLELANDRRRFGSPRLHELLRREALVQNHKRTERIYQEEGLSLRTRKRVKRPSHARIVQAGPAGPDEQWAMDFVSDSLMGGRRIRVLTIADLWDRSSPALEVDMSLPGVRVVRVLFKVGCHSVSRLITGRNLAVRPWIHGLLSTVCRLSSLVRGSPRIMGTLKVLTENSGMSV